MKVKMAEAEGGGTEHRNRTYTTLRSPGFSVRRDCHLLEQLWSRPRTVRNPYKRNRSNALG